jgi:hypothetical protein
MEATEEIPDWLVWLNATTDFERMLMLCYVHGYAPKAYDLAKDNTLRSRNAAFDAAPWDTPVEPFVIDEVSP